MFKRKHAYFCFFLLMTSVPTFSFADDASDIEAFKHSWTAAALKLQDKIDLNTPFNQATILGTHNSYNAQEYQIPFLRYNDPNQLLSIYHQLEMGIRSVEFDAHWAMGRNREHDILLCHSGSEHDACSTFDRPIREGLEELKTWLEENPNEIVLLYIERHVDGHEPRLASEIEKYLGSFIYKPSLLRKDPHSKNCVALPGDLTKAKILQAGKQLLIVTKGCDANPHHKEENQFPENWNDYGFAGIGPIPAKPFTFIDGKIDQFTPSPDCAKSLFAADRHHVSMWRIFEDQRPSTNPLDKHIEDADMAPMMLCNINWQSFDMLKIADSRLSAAIWSWAINYPKNDNGHCAFYELGEGIKNTSCEDNVFSYVCLDSASQQFKILNQSGLWKEGEKACQSADTNLHFATPVNGKQMGEIKSLMTAKGLTQVWLNYKTNEQNNWVANEQN